MRSLHRHAAPHDPSQTPHDCAPPTAPQPRDLSRVRHGPEGSLLQTGRGRHVREDGTAGDGPWEVLNAACNSDGISPAAI